MNPSNIDPIIVVILNVHPKTNTCVLTMKSMQFAHTHMHHTTASGYLVVDEEGEVSSFFSSTNILSSTFALSFNVLVLSSTSRTSSNPPQTPVPLTLSVIPIAYEAVSKAVYIVVYIYIYIYVCVS